MNTIFQPSELIINSDGSIFHLHMRPEQLADKIILVGDPGRVSLVSAHFDKIESEQQSREFHSTTGLFRGNRISVISTGIGADNIDIVMNEIDALANIDFASRTLKPKMRRLDIVRIGTCGGLQPETPLGSFVCSARSIGLDGLLNFYAARDSVCDLDMERQFIKHMGWGGHICQPVPYAICANSSLTEKIASSDMVRGITVTCGGFFGPQGRQLRLALADPRQNEKIETFSYAGLKVTNFEMESAAVAGMAAMMGHRATTCCMVIANRRAGTANSGYKTSINDLIALVLEHI